MTSGRWVEIEKAWHETSVRACPVCGSLIPRRTWVIDGGAGEIELCSPACEDLYAGYWRPRYGVLESDDRH